MIKIYDFENSSDYSKVNTEISAGKGKLILVNNENQTSVEDFSDDVGFVYDNTKAEFIAGKVQQKDKRPANATFGATYNSSINGNWGNGVLTGTAFGGASVLNGKLDLKGGSKYVVYQALNNADSAQVGCVRLKYTPNYSGAPSLPRGLFSLSKTEATLQNAIYLYHHSNGNLYTAIYNASGVVIFNDSMGAWNPVSGTEYEIELNWDITTGASRLFIDGTQFGATITGTGVRTSEVVFCKIGAAYNSTLITDAEFDDVVIFSTVQHTANYTKGYTLQDYIYLESEIVLLPFTYSGPGLIKALTDLVVVLSGSPRFTTENKYWNGSIWTASNGSYAQANDSTTIVSNLNSLNVDGEEIIAISVVFQDSNSQSYIDNLILEYTGQKYADEGNLITLDYIKAKDINSISAIINEPSLGNTVTFAAILNDIKKYYNGSAWVNSNGAFAQTNTLAELVSNIGTLISQNSFFKLYVLLRSDDGSETPDISEVNVNYLFGGIIEGETLRSNCFLELEDLEGIKIEGAIVTIEINRDSDQYVEAAERIIAPAKQKTTDQNGYVSFELAYSSEFDVSGTDHIYKMKIQKDNINLLTQYIGKEEITFDVPDQLETNLTSLLNGI
jgi:hypothetical protein